MAHTISINKTESEYVAYAFWLRTDIIIFVFKSDFMLHLVLPTLLPDTSRKQWRIGKVVFYISFEISVSYKNIFVLASVLFLLLCVWLEVLLVLTDCQTTWTIRAGADLHTKFRLYKSGSQMSNSAQSLSGMAVDECATACLDEDMFTCDTFSYCYTTGDCYLNTNRPSTNQDLIVSNPYCDLYTRQCSFFALHSCSVLYTNFVWENQQTHYKQ